MAWNVRATTGPTPGTVCNRLTTGSDVASRWTAASAARICRSASASSVRNGATTAATSVGIVRRASRGTTLDADPLGNRKPSLPEGGADQINQRGPDANDLPPRAQLLPTPSLGGRDAVRATVHALAARIRQRRDVPAIGFDPARAGRIHRDVIRIGHNHLVATRLEALRDPFAVRAAFEQEAHLADTARTTRRHWPRWYRCAPPPRSARPR